jgi:iron only hydrogenase large subunit-like protein
MAENYPLHSIKVDEKKCIGCVACMRACPTRAIRVRNFKARIIDERCIDCGECLRVCPSQAIIPITTSASFLNRFKYKIALPSPALYSQFGQDIMPSEILDILGEIGFDHVYDEAMVCEMTSLAIEEYLDENLGSRPVLSSTCPVIVRLIQRLFPSLCHLILPLEPPREIAAKNLREEIAKERGLAKEDIGIIHITPCPAKLVSINRPETLEKSFLDGAISIKEIFNQVMMKIKKTKRPTIFKSPHPTSGIGVGWAVEGGEIRSLKYFHTVSVSGVYDTIRILEDVESGKLKNIEYLECMICPDGCVGGPLTVENRFIAKSNILRLSKIMGDQKIVDRALVKRLYREKFFSFEQAVKPKPFPPLDPNRDESIRKMEMKEAIIKRLPGINCCVCGAPDCPTLAEDIVRGNAKIDDCIYPAREAGAGKKGENNEG